VKPQPIVDPGVAEMLAEVRVKSGAAWAVKANAAAITSQVSRFIFAFLYMGWLFETTSVWDWLPAPIVACTLKRAEFGHPVKLMVTLFETVAPGAMFP